MNDQILIRMVGITKTFPRVIANDAVDFDVRNASTVICVPVSGLSVFCHSRLTLKTRDAIFCGVESAFS